MTEEELREIARNNYAAQMEMLGYQTDGNPKDMVEVVRCKDCRYYDPEWVDEECRLFRDFTTNPDWFCADGERKSETEIVRCKDCKHFGVEDQSCKYHGMYISLKPDNYCAHGERR